MTMKRNALIVSFILIIMTLVPLVGLGEDSRTFIAVDAYVNFYGEEGAEQSIGSGDNLGHAIAKGDINNDGLADLVVSAPWADGAGNAREDSGMVYVLYGNQSEFYNSPPMFEVVPNYVDIIIYGADAGDNAGMALALGDLNNDGFDDIVISAPRGQGIADTGADMGEVSVIYGGNESDMFASYDLATDANVTIFGETDDGMFGDEVLCADLDNDGFDDLFVGETYGDGVDSVNRKTGRVFIEWGSAVSLSGDQGASAMMDAEMYGNTMTDRFGKAMAKGDFDGDGAIDVAISSYLGDGPDAASKFASGEVYLFYGGAGRIVGKNLDVETVRDIILYGKDNDDQMGYSLAMGDMDGDGKDELVIGSMAGDGPNNGFNNMGEVDIIWGTTQGTIQNDVDLATYDHLIIYGVYPNDWFGYTVFCGQLTMDSLIDLCVYSYESDGLYDNLTDAGSVSFIRGSAALKTSDDFSVLDDDGIINFCGQQDEELYGYSISCWDVTYNNKPDLVVGSKWFNGDNGSSTHMGKFQVITHLGPSPTLNDNIQITDYYRVNGNDTMLAGRPISLLVNVSDSNGEDKITEVIVRINPFTDDIRIGWDKTLGIIEIDDPSGFVNVLGTSTMTTETNKMMLDLQLEFGWDYMNITTVDVLCVGSGSDLDRRFYDIDMINEIEFKGETVVTYDSAEIGPGNWTLAGDELVFTNTSLVYKGTDIGPLTDDFVPMLVTPDGNYTMGGTFTPGDAVDVAVTIGQNETMDYAMSLLAFTGDANLSSVTTPQFDFSVKVDNATPEMTAGLICKPDNDTEAYLDNDTEVYAAWSTGVDTGCGVNNYLVSFDTTSIYTNDTWAMLDGLSEGETNVSVAAVDNLDQEGPSDYFLVIVDMTPVEIVIDEPANATEFNYTDIAVNVTITDLLTGVNGGSIQYRVSSNGTENYADWVDFPDVDDNMSLECGVTLSFPEGENNYVQWRAYDLVGNMMESANLNVIVELDEIVVDNEPPIPKITGPVNGSEHDLGIVELDASGTSDPEDDDLTYTWLVDGVEVGTGEVFEYNFSSVGNYTVTLEVDDGEGNVVTSDIEVTINAPYCPPGDDDVQDDDDDEGINPLFIALPIVAVVVLLILVVIIVIVLMKRGKGKKEDEMQQRIDQEKQTWEEQRRQEEIARADPNAVLTSFEHEQEGTGAYIAPGSQVEGPPDQTALPQEQEKLPPGETPPVEEDVSVTLPEDEATPPEMAAEPEVAGTPPETQQPETQPEEPAATEPELESTEPAEASNEPASGEEERVGGSEDPAGEDQPPAETEAPPEVQELEQVD